MAIFTKQGIKVLFIHIPKTGGTTFAEAMIDLGWEPSFYIRGKSPNELSHLKTTPQHYHSRLLKKIFNLDEFDLQLAIIRNPFERIKSEFYWQNRQGEYYPDPETWLRTAKEGYRKNKYIYDNHIRPQKHFITPAAEIFKLEEKGIISALRRCQSLIKSQTQQDHDRLATLELPFKWKTSRKQELEAQFEKLKEDINDFYQSDYEIWENLSSPYQQKLKHTIRNRLPAFDRSPQ